jgi:hypothetical protein
MRRIQREEAGRSLSFLVQTSAGMKRSAAGELAMWCCGFICLKSVVVAPISYPLAIESRNKFR